MSHAYRVTVQSLPDASQSGGSRELTFDVTNHDEITQLVERVKAQRIVPEEEAAAFIVGLKLFGEVMLHHRQEPLFADLFGHFGAFMKRLKADASRTSEASGPHSRG